MKIVVSDLLDIEQGMIVHGCNAQGVMGAGVADQIRRKYYHQIKIAINNYVNEIKD